MVKPDYVKLRKILDLQEPHVYSWSTLTIKSQHTLFKIMSKIPEDIDSDESEEAGEDSEDE